MELKRDANAQVVLNNLYKHTALETSFAVNMLAIDHGRPKLLSIKDALNCYMEHRREVVLRRTRYQLRQAQQRAETLEGYLIALAHLDDFIEIIRGSANRAEARVKLLAYEFTRSAGRADRSSHQERSPFDRRILCLQRTPGRSDPRSASLPAHRPGDEIRSPRSTEIFFCVSRTCSSILESAQRVMDIIKEELKLVKEKYGSARLTQIVPDEGEINLEDLIANEGCIITITHGGYIKRTAVSAFRAQRRGGRGVIGMTTREGQAEGEADDFVEHLFTASTHDSLMFFTQSGRCYVEKVYEIPEMSRASKGRAIANLLELRPEEKIAATLRIEARRESSSEENMEDGYNGRATWNPDLHVMFATQSGIVKKTNLVRLRQCPEGRDYCDPDRGGR